MILGLKLRLFKLLIFVIGICESFCISKVSEFNGLFFYPSMFLIISWGKFDSSMSLFAPFLLISGNKSFVLFTAFIPKF